MDNRKGTLLFLASMQPLESDAEHSHNQLQSLLSSYLHNIGQGESRSACFDAADVPHQMQQNSCHQVMRSPKL